MVELPAEGKRDLEAAISAAGDSEDPGVYLKAFQCLGKLLFNNEADKCASLVRGPDFERALIEDVIPMVVESIFPSKGTVPAIGSDHRKSLSIRHDLNTGILSEREPGSDWGRPSRDAQAIYARVSYWDEFAPAGARLALYDSPETYDRFREALRQHLERQALVRIHRSTTTGIREIAGRIREEVGNGGTSSWNPAMFKECPRLASFYDPNSDANLGRPMIGVQSQQDDDAPPQDAEPFVPDPFADDGPQPFGGNPFPESHPAHTAFDEATWQAKADLNRLRLELITSAGDPQKDPIQAMLTFRVSAFDSMAKAGQLTVDNTETAAAFERWLEDFARFLLSDTVRIGQLKDPDAGPDQPPLFRPEILKQINTDLTQELMKVVAFHKHQLSERVLLGLQQVAGAKVASANFDENRPDPNPVQDAVLGNQTPSPKGAEGNGPAVAARRQAFVMPILGQKGLSRGRWATMAGVSPNSVYEYLDGKRRLSPENRKAMADVLGLKPEQLPE